MAQHKVISLVRQSGSGGGYIGAKVADKLGIACYDHQLHEMALKLGGLDEAKHAEVFKSITEEKKPNLIFYRTYNEGNEQASSGESPEDMVYDLEAKMIRKIAQNEDAVFIGRCSNWVLKDEDCKLLSIYVVSSLEAKIKRITHYSDMDEAAARKHIKKIDAQRDEFYYYITRTHRDDFNNYGIILNSSKYDDDTCVEFICRMYDAL